MLAVRCPKCQHDMLYDPKGSPKSKRCVYCGTTFAVHSTLSTNRIVAEGMHSKWNRSLF